MSQDDQKSASAAAREVADHAATYFALRELLEAARAQMVESMLQANLDWGVTQFELSEACALVGKTVEVDVTIDLRGTEVRATADGSLTGDKDWEFHRTRIQQFLVDARRARRESA